MTLFLTGDPRPIHFMGIAGAGMSALAMIARHRGVAITGCDSDTSGAGVADLTALGVQVWQGHDPSHVDAARAVVVTAAVPREHPELERARALGLRSEEHTSELQSRSDLVCRLLLEKKKKKTKSESLIQQHMLTNTAT